MLVSRTATTSLVRLIAAGGTACRLLPQYAAHPALAIGEERGKCQEEEAGKSVSSTCAMSSIRRQGPTVSTTSTSQSTSNSWSARRSRLEDADPGTCNDVPQPPDVPATARRRVQVRLGGRSRGSAGRCRRARRGWPRRQSTGSTWSAVRAVRSSPVHRRGRARAAGGTGTRTSACCSATSSGVAPGVGGGGDEVDARLYQYLVNHWFDYEDTGAVVRVKAPVLADGREPAEGHRLHRRRGSQEPG